MSTLEELGLKDEVLPQTAPEQIPDEYSGAAPPPYPGVYTFRLPADMGKIWKKYDVKLDEAGYPVWGDELAALGDKAKAGERLGAAFRDDAALVITNSVDGSYVNEAFNWHLTSFESRRGKRDDPTAPRVSDSYYLLVALGSTNPQPKTNKELVAELMKFAGREFKAKLEWETNCNPNADAYFADDAGNVATAVDESGANYQGCGTKHFMSDWPKDETGRYLDRKTCTCGAALRPFGRLRQFKPVG